MHLGGLHIFLLLANFNAAVQGYVWILGIFWWIKMCPFEFRNYQKPSFVCLFLDLHPQPTKKNWIRWCRNCINHETNYTNARWCWDNEKTSPRVIHKNRNMPLVFDLMGKTRVSMPPLPPSGHMWNCRLVSAKMLQMCKRFHAKRNHIVIGTTQLITNS